MRCHCGAGGATAVLLRQQGGSMTSCGGYIYGGGFRSFSLPFSLLMRTLLLLLLLLLVYYCYSYLVMPPKRVIIGRTVELGKASKKTFTPIPSVDESSHDEHDDGVMQPKRATIARTVVLGKANKKTPTPTENTSSYTTKYARSSTVQAPQCNLSGNATAVQAPQ